MHDEFKALELQLLREQHPGAMVLVHPESPARRGGARPTWWARTTQLLKAVDRWRAPEYIVATDNGLMHRMRQLAPDKMLIEAPTAGNSATCKSCAHCPWMAMNALQGVVACLETGSGEVRGARTGAQPALGCIERMLDFVKANPASLAQPQSGFVPNIGVA